MLSTFLYVLNLIVLPFVKYLKESHPLVKGAPASAFRNER